MRNVNRSALALLALSVVLAGCSYSNGPSTPNESGDKVAQTGSTQAGANEVVLSIPGMT